jgi:vesicle-fusing ATPase
MYVSLTSNVFSHSRANPEAAKRLGVNHVRGILLSGPPGCGKTLLARELAQMLGARPAQIVNGPEILDKFVGEAEKNIRALFTPAEIEYAQVGDQSALHVIILDEMDAIARKRGSVTGDSTGVRDSVVNQLLAKMDGVKEANNVLVVGLTNRPELLDPALLRPGRLEVQLRVELPDLSGRRDILRIHTRQMKEAGGVSTEAQTMLEDLGDYGFPARTEYFTGAELAGLVRSAASFALARAVECDEPDEDSGIVSVHDLETALTEVRPALGKQDEVLEMRFPSGISAFSPSMERVLRDLNRFISTPELERGEYQMTPKIESMMLVGSADNGGTGATALACWAAVQASTRDEAKFVRLVTSLDLLTSGGGDEASRAAALAEKFSEAQQMPDSILILDDVDQLISGSGPDGYSSVMLATLRALLRSPPASANSAKAGRHTRTLKVLAASSRNDAACAVLHKIFDETLLVPQLVDKESVRRLIGDTARTTGLAVANINALADLISERLGTVGCKTVLRLLDRCVSAASSKTEKHQVEALTTILDDLACDSAFLDTACQIY